MLLNAGQDARVSPGTLMLVHVPQEEHILLTFRALYAHPACLASPRAALSDV